MGLFAPVSVMKQGLVALALLFLACGVLAQSCRYTDGTNGCEYDFSSLVITQGPPYYEFDDTDPTTNATGSYEVNICAPVDGTPCATGSGVCQTVVEGASYNCGNARSDFAPLLTATPGTCGGAVLKYIDGTPCPGAGVKRESNINIRCNASVPTAVITSIRETAPCVYLIEMDSAQACGTSVNITASMTPSMTPSASSSASVPASSSTSPSVLPSGTSPSASASLSLTMSASMSAAMSPSMSPTMSPTMSPSQSLVNSNDTTSGNSSTGGNTTSNSTAGDTNSSTSSGSGWIWWVVGGIAIVVVVAAVGAAGFVVYKKKQQSYDSIGYE